MNKFWRLNGPLEIQSHYHTLFPASKPNRIRVTRHLCFHLPLLSRRIRRPITQCQAGIKDRESPFTKPVLRRRSLASYSYPQHWLSALRQPQTLELGHTLGLSILAADSSIDIYTLPVYP